MKAAFSAVVAAGLMIGFVAGGGKAPRAAPAPAPSPLADAGTRGAIASSPVAVPGDASGGDGRETVIERGAGGHFFAFAEVNGEPVRFVVDTGATSVALTEEDARRAGVAFDPARFEVVGSGASGDVRGQEVTLNAVDLDGKKMEDIHGVVLEGLTVSLLGQNYLRRLDTVSISGDTMRLK